MICALSQTQKCAFCIYSVVAEVLQEADEEGWCLLLRAAALPPDGATRFTVGSLSLRTRLLLLITYFINSTYPHKEPSERWPV
jgi:hypothetical protein